ncbi:MAG: VOC family protein [Parvularcula sp.]|jgi:predicted 3-demethylubiquinone-9 3-methyltransferase (glyoxalase superfamily)|nr:VOC family protein [Parvularcula sp.]
MAAAPKVRTCLGFNGNGDEAAAFYVSLLPDSFIETKSYPDPGGAPLVIEFTLAGVPYMVLNAGPNFEHSMATSISVLTEDQAETDKLWSKLLEDGGEERRCGWLVDRFGVSWQIMPKALPHMMNADDKEAAMRAREAMMQMTKIDIARLEAAFSKN